MTANVIVLHDRGQQHAVLLNTTTGLPLPVPVFTGYDAGQQAEEFIDWAEAKRDADILAINDKILDRLRFAWDTEWSNRLMGAGEKQAEAKARDYP